MMVLHVAAECYPAAKTGGLGDVAGALPKYQCAAGLDAKLVMPMYRLPFLYTHEWEVDFKGVIYIDGHRLDYTIIKEKNDSLGFNLYQVDIQYVLDREKIYGYEDDVYRFIAFQTAVVDWINHWQVKPDIIHCHDHHAALIPFFVKYCYQYDNLSYVPTVLTIHNAEYQGWIGWEHRNWLPHFDDWKTGMLDWNNTVNSLASGVKNAWKVNAVSKGYLDELQYHSNGLERLFEYEKGKCSGILNGIDTELWDPMTDQYLSAHFSTKNIVSGKEANKEAICERFHIDNSKPLFAFIGRLVGEKAADILPDAVLSSLYLLKDKAAFIFLGSGEQAIEAQLARINGLFPTLYHAEIGYNEALSHQLYAASDFLLMPSRVEPCGLNQMYAMRYGSIPVVRRTGGLAETVRDIGDGGWGICFDNASAEDVVYSVSRAISLYENPSLLADTRKEIMNIDHSWDKTVIQYETLYQSCH